MRILSLILLIFVAISPIDAMARTKILLPSSDTGNDDSNTPNLGLIPRAPAPQVGDMGSTTEAAPVPVPSVQNDSNCDVSGKCGKASNSAAIVSTTNPIPSGITPGGKLAPANNAAVGDQQKQSNQTAAKGILPKAPANATQQKAYSYQPAPRAPIFINEQPEIDMKGAIENIKAIISQNPETSSTYLNMQLNNNINIAVSPEYLWGPNDVEIIGKIFGYAPNQVAANCQLRIRNQMKTDKGFYTSKVFAGQQKRLDYDGEFREISTMPTAVCNVPKGPLPQNGGVITRIGDKYSIIIGKPVTCSRGQKNVVSLEIKYNGDSDASCRFN